MSAGRRARGMLAAALGVAVQVLAVQIVAMQGASADPGVSRTAIRIGQSAGVTGPVAGSVKEQIAGAQVYLNTVNAAGGVGAARSSWSPTTTASMRGARPTMCAS